MVHSGLNTTSNGPRAECSEELSKLHVSRLTEKLPEACPIVLETLTRQHSCEMKLGGIDALKTNRDLAIVDRRLLLFPMHAGVFKDVGDAKRPSRGVGAEFKTVRLHAHVDG